MGVGKRQWGWSGWEALASTTQPSSQKIRKITFLGILLHHSYLTFYYFYNFILPEPRIYIAMILLILE